MNTTIDVSRVSALTRDEQDAMEELVNLANLDRRGVFQNPRLQPGSLGELYEGHLAVRILEDEALIGCGTVNMRDDVGWIHILAAAPSHRGRGLGAQLIDAANNIAVENDLKTLRLEAVDTGNLIAFYLGQGFKETLREEKPVGHWRAREPFDLVTLERSVI